MKRGLWLFYIYFTAFAHNVSSQTWDSVPGKLGPSGGATRVAVLYVDNNKLYAGGWFQKAGNLTVNHIAYWNGVSWGNLGAGITFGTRPKSFMSYNNELYAAGDFYEAGYVPNTRSIARWNGTNWNSVDGGALDFVNTVRAMAVYNGELYIGSSILGLLGGKYIRCVASWDGSQWDSVAAPSTGQVHALAVYNNELYAGGLTSYIGGISIANIARWDGNQWKAVGLGVNGQVNTMFVDTINNDLYVGGGFFNAFNSDSTSVKTTFIAKWDGNEWSSLGDDTIPGAFAITMYHGELYVAGTILSLDDTLQGIARWDGRQWKPLGSGTNNSTRALAVWNDALYVGGQFTVAGNDSAYYIAKWHTPNVPTCLNFSAAIASDADAVFLPDSTVVQFYDNSNVAATGWYWDFGDGNSDTVQNPQHSFDSLGTYTVTLITTCGYNSRTAYKIITVFDNCNAIGAAIYTSFDTVKTDSAIQFTDSSIFSSAWLWDFGDGGSDTVQNPLHIYNSPGTYTITLIASIGSCSDTAYGTIIVESSVGVDEFNTRSPKLKVYPNPTKDSFTIGAYIPKTKDGVIRIFDIKGELIKEYALKKGSNSTILNTSGWAKGVYICSLEVGGEVVQSKKMVVE